MGRSHDIARGASTMYQTQTASDARYVNVTGDSMTGNLEVDGIIEIDKTGDHPALRFVEDGSNTRGYMGSGDWAINGLANDDFGISSSSTGDLVLGTGAGTERLRINSAGIVTKPNQPAFGTRGYSTTTTQIASMNPLLWSNVHTNIGNCFDNSTGKFTFPVSGRYYYECNVNLKAADASWMGLYFVYNGTAQHNSWSRDGAKTDYDDTIVSGITDATANDYMAFCWHNSYVSPVQNNTTYNYASIHLIG